MDRFTRRHTFIGELDKNHLKRDNEKNVSILDIINTLQQQDSFDMI